MSSGIQKSIPQPQSAPLVCTHRQTYMPCGNFVLPKSGTVDIAMLEDQIRLTSASFVEAADGVYVSILLSTGDSVTELKVTNGYSREMARSSILNR